MSGRPPTNGHPDEQRLVKLYMDLTGSPESGARSVVMYLNLATDLAETDPQSKHSETLPILQSDASVTRS